MPSNFASYKGGIQADPNFYKMATAPTQIMAESLVNATNSLVKGYLMGQERKKEDAYKAQEAERKNLDVYVKGSQKILENDMSVSDASIQMWRDNIGGLQQQYAMLTATPQDRIANKARTDEIDSQIKALQTNINAELNVKRDKLKQQNKILTSALLRGVDISDGTSKPADNKKSDSNATLESYSELGNESPSQGGQPSSSWMPSGFRAPAQYGVNQYMPQEQNQKGAPVAKTGSSPFQPVQQLPEVQGFSSDGLVQPIGTTVTDFAIRYPYGNVYENDKVPPGVSAQVLSKDGKLVLGISPLATEEDDPTINTLAGFVGGLNKIGNSDRIELSNMLSEPGKAGSQKMYEELKAKGMIPGQVSLIDFQASYAVQAQERGNTDELSDNLDADQQAVLGRVTSPASGLPLGSDVKAPAIVDQRATGVTSEISYQGDASAAPDLPAAPPSIYKRMLEMGVTDKNTLRSANSLDSLNYRRWEIDYKAAQYELDRRKAQAEAVQAQASVIRAEQSIRQTEQKITATGIQVGRELMDLSGAFPGYATSEGGSSLLGVVHESVFKDNGILKKIYDRELRNGVQSGSLPVNSDYYRAWSAIQQNIGMSMDDAKANTKKFGEEVSAWRQSVSMITPLLGEFERQATLSGPRVQWERQFGAEPAIASSYRLFLIGAFRKATVGVGNPSNFEQELLLNLVSDPKALFQITGNSVARTRALLLISTGSLVRGMKENNFVASDKTLNEITQSFRRAGLISGEQKVTRKMLTEFDDILQKTSGDPVSQLRDLRNWCLSNSIDPNTTNLLSGLETRAVDKSSWISANTAAATEARRRIDDFTNNTK